MLVTEEGRVTSPETWLNTRLLPMASSLEQLLRSMLALALLKAFRPMAVSRLPAAAVMLMPTVVFYETLANARFPMLVTLAGRMMSEARLMSL